MVTKNNSIVFLMSSSNNIIKSNLKRLALKLLNLKRRVFYYHQSVILRVDKPPAIISDDLTLIAHDNDKEYVLWLYSALGRIREFGRSNLRRIIANRCNYGMRFYELKHEDKCIATMWVHERGYRFIDELMYGVRLPEKTIWLRDVYVDYNYRGKRLYSKMIGMLVKEYYPNVEHIYSDTVKDNIKSLRAHKHAGFHIVGYINLFKLFGYFILRSRIPEELRTIDSVSGGAPKVFFLKDIYRKHVRENII